MLSRKLLVTAAVAAIGAGGAGPALAAKPKPKPAPSKTTIRAIVRNSSYTINRGTFFGLRWSRDVYQIKAGGTLTFVSSKDEPHTFTFVKFRRDLPRTTKALDAFGECKPKLCQTMFQAHQVDPQTFEPANPVVDVNKTGVDTGARPTKAGDSWFAGPGTPSVKVPVSARRGTTLNLLCLIHPWMQARVQVK